MVGLNLHKDKLENSKHNVDAVIYNKSEGSCQPISMQIESLFNQFNLYDKNVFEVSRMFANAGKEIVSSSRGIQSRTESFQRKITKSTAKSK